MREPTMTRIREVVPALEWHPQTTSTNAVALARAEEGAPSGLLILAGEQTAGRGRRERSWHAPPGTSVLASLLWRPSLPRLLWPRFSLAAGLALDEVARQHLATDRVALKWPNDLLVDGVKAAGILLETTADAVVVGMGLNVDWTGVERPADIRATSLAEGVASAEGEEVLGADGPPDVDGVAVALAEALMRWMANAEADPAGIVAAYIPRCGTLSTAVTAHGVPGHDQPVTGQAVGLTPDGHLRIRSEDGSEVVVSAGDVEHLR